MTKQLTLGIALRDDATFDNFFPGENIVALNSLLGLVDAAPEKILYLWGGKGSGKSHLLQACCHEASRHQAQAIYLPLREPQLSPDILQDLEAMAVICIDDVDYICGHAQWEEALMNLYNRVRMGSSRLILASQLPPPEMPCKLADLRSRLAWGLSWPLKSLNDLDKLKALQQRAKQRGFILSDEVANFLLRHNPRDTTALFSLLDKLDQASLAEQRKITIPFAKKVIEKI